MTSRLFPLTRGELDNAAFWDEAICLDCGAILTAEDTDADMRCEECGSDAVFSARFLQRAHRFVEDLDE